MLARFALLACFTAYYFGKGTIGGSLFIAVAAVFVVADLLRTVWTWRVQRTQRSYR